MVLGVLILHFKHEIGILTCVKGGDVDVNCPKKCCFQVMWIEVNPVDSNIGLIWLWAWVLSLCHFSNHLYRVPLKKKLVSSLILSHVYSVYGLHFNCWKNGEAILRNQNYLKLILWLYFSRMCMNSCMEFAFERNKSVVAVFWESPTGCLIYYYVWALSMRHVQILLIIPDLLKYYYCVSLSLRAAWALLWVRNLVEVYAFNICGSVSACLDYFWCRYWLQYDLLWNV